jgi:hypothetical protein
VIEDPLERTKIAKSALLFFGESAVVNSCVVHDVTKSGTGVFSYGAEIYRWNSHYLLTISDRFA